ncbi:DNA polymerase II large subunit [Archaeoglobus veneficus]|uniref:DNA polymerase II large subunit n=1 Tax=Archaeoglobus veneficus (strain DSM 11195 / SNP6) TaxID=693661 RepID=F2KSZ3_ARCVS|nr:DNA polymerase II large subunit [Archaeoglobus veneficus]AEA47023.1 transcriptional regulator, XRE family [Archaeoglobus veneficus SNP6]
MLLTLDRFFPLFDEKESGDSEDDRRFSILLDEIRHYHELLLNEVERVYAIAREARKKGLDPSTEVEIPIARNMAERVERLLHIDGIAERIMELEESGVSREKICFIVAEEIVKGKFGSFDRLEAIDKAVRSAVAILTEGVVAAPIEGIAKVKIDRNDDGSEFLKIYYAGPIRSAGGTAQVISVLVGDYVRRILGLNRYIPTEQEILRYIEEIPLYKKVANLQYLPSDEEIRLIVSNCPVCIDGEPTEDAEVSGYRNLPRVETNRVRGGMALVIAEGIALKAPKLKKLVDVLGIDGWEWLDKLINKGGDSGSDGKEENEAIKPKDKYLSDIVAGRPVFSHPSRKGGFRLRYGRARNSGFATVGINPATMVISDNFIAVGTQLKVERPGKAGSVVPVTSIEGPTVRLKNGDVIRVDTIQEALAIKDDIDAILDMGEILINYGDFLENNHPLLPSPFVYEWWIQEVKDKVPKGDYRRIDEDTALMLCDEYGVPLHPDYTYLWHDLSVEEVLYLRDWISTGKIEGKYGKSTLVVEMDKKGKEILEKLLLEHKVRDGRVVIEKWKVFVRCLGLNTELKKCREETEAKDALELVRKLSDLDVRARSPSRIGARMGRPEKAKERLMSPPPHVLFPIGHAGGKTRDIKNAINYTSAYNAAKGTISVEVATRKCRECGKETIWLRCECGGMTEQYYRCPKCGMKTGSETCPKCGEETLGYSRRNVNIRELYENALRNVNERDTFSVIKGVIGLTSKNKVPERLEKGILRAKHGIAVFKDGTIRYDMTDVPITHFRPREIGVSVEKLKELGYSVDWKGNELKSEEQIVELKPQDIILAKNAAEYLVRVAKFVDDLLVKFYGMEPFYKVEKPEDLIGHLVIGLAPHTSAGVLGRIIGFADVLAGYAHPYFHAAKRRNCLHPREKVVVRDSEGIKILQIGEIVEKYKPGEIEVLHYDEGKLVWKIPRDFVRIKSPKKLLKIRTEYGREIIVTPDHKFPILDENTGELIEVKAEKLRPGDVTLTACKVPVSSEVKEINVVEHFVHEKYRAHGLRDVVKEKAKEKGITIKELCKQLGISRSAVDKDSIPMNVLHRLSEILGLNINEVEFRITHRKKFISVPSKIKLTREFGFLVGMYLSDGFARSNNRLNQVSVASSSKEVAEMISKIFKDLFGYRPSIRKDGNVYVLTASGKTIYKLFVDVLGLGRNAREKRIPWFAFNNKEFALGVISGLIQGDGSVGKEVSITTVNRDLVNDIVMLMLTLGIFAGISYENRQHRSENYIEYKVRIYSRDTIQELIDLGLIKTDKTEKLASILERSGASRRKEFGDAVLVKIKEIEQVDSDTEYVYDFVIDGNKTFVAGQGGLITIDCDGDEDCVMLLLDGLLNFSRSYLPDKRGGRMDAPLVLTVIIDPKEVDSEVHNMDIVETYPLEFYQATLRYASPKELTGIIERVEDRLESDLKYCGLSFTHDTADIAAGVKESAYKALKSMQDKVKAQMRLAEKIMAVDEHDVAEKVISCHFLPDIIGNLRAFSRQEFRCVNCNQKYRRIPLQGKCVKCGGKLTLSVHGGSIKKYLDISKYLSETYNVSEYTKQRLMLIDLEIRSLFESDTRKQVKIMDFF